LRDFFFYSLYNRLKKRSNLFFKNKRILKRLYKMVAISQTNLLMLGVNTWLLERD